MMMQPCAKDCPDRSAECRLTCTKWAEYTTERDKDYEKRLAKWMGNEDCYAKANKIQRLMRKKRRR